MTAWKSLVIGLLLAGSAMGKEELNLYIWSEYLEPDLIAAFEAENDCKVIESNYENCEEMVAKLQAGGLSQYDLVFPSDYIVPSMIELGLLENLDHSKIPNIGNLSETFADPDFDKGNKYSAAYQWGTIGLVYSKAAVGGDVDSWGALLNATDKVRFSLFDSEREMTGIALRYLGYSVNSTNKKELKAAADLMIAAKKKDGYAGFDANVAGISKVKAKSLDISVCYSGDAFMAMDEDENIGYCIPKEGTVVWCDSMCIPAKAPNKELAYKFINFILDAKNGAQLSNYIMFATPNAASLPFIEPEQLSNPSIYPDAETEKKLEFILDAGANTALFGEVWKMVKTR
jgi:spermidine/putrescine transport system substrate-binding protein